VSGVSPTAHYTGYVWAQHGLSHPQLATLQGRVLFDAARPMNFLSQTLGGPTLESYLLARHRALDTLLEQAIDEGVTQVIEVASGLSPRGWRFTERYGDRLTYIEADLPDMAERKRRALAEMGSLSDQHRVVALDALARKGPLSLAALAAKLNADEGLAIVTEGLLSYLPTDAVHDLWGRFARELSRFASGRYVSDIALGGGDAAVWVRGFLVALSAFVRQRVHVHFRDPGSVEAALLEAGFASASVRPAVEVVPPQGDMDLGVQAANVLFAAT
jgi:O-methyltransferase involved in polyketide biosynthesis